MRDTGQRLNSMILLMRSSDCKDCKRIFIFKLLLSCIISDHIIMIFGKYVNLFQKLEFSNNNEELTIVEFSNNGADIKVRLL